MKVLIYIQKSDFDQFFKWLNRLEQGILTTPEIQIYTQEFKDSLQISLDSATYKLISNALKDLEMTQSIIGEVKIEYLSINSDPETRIISDILKNASLYDKEAEIVKSALELIHYIPGISPSEAMVIAERDFLKKA